MTSSVVAEYLRNSSLQYGKILPTKPVLIASINLALNANTLARSPVLKFSPSAPSSVSILESDESRGNSFDDELTLTSPNTFSISLIRRVSLSMTSACAKSL